MPKVNITLSPEIHRWWKENRWINLSQLLEKELRRLQRMEEFQRGATSFGAGACPRCGSTKLRFIDGVNYRCANCGALV